MVVKAGMSVTKTSNEYICGSRNRVRRVIFFENNDYTTVLSKGGLKFLILLSVVKIKTVRPLDSELYLP